VPLSELGAGLLYRHGERRFSVRLVSWFHYRLGVPKSYPPRIFLEPEEYRCRFSFCCDRDGCRKRMTPPSVRFLGRKVYLGAVVILISAMRQGPTPRRVHEISTLFGVDRATVARWQAFWRDYIPQTPFWKLARGRVVPVVEIVVLPLSLLEAFRRTKDPCQDWGYLLRFLSPLSVPSNPLIKMM
jgi:hypothetical protein